MHHIYREDWWLNQVPRYVLCDCDGVASYMQECVCRCVGRSMRQQSTSNNMYGFLTLAMSFLYFKVEINNRSKKCKSFVLHVCNCMPWKQCSLYQYLCTYVYKHTHTLSLSLSVPLTWAESLFSSKSLYKKEKKTPTLPTHHGFLPHLCHVCCCFFFFFFLHVITGNIPINQLTNQSTMASYVHIESLFLTHAIQVLIACLFFSDGFLLFVFILGNGKNSPTLMEWRRAWGHCYSLSVWRGRWTFHAR